MPYRKLLLTLFLGLTLAGCADTLNGGGYHSSYGPYGGPYDWADNGSCDDPNYNISGFGDAWPGTDEYDCRRWGGGLRGTYYGWTADRYYDWQRRDFEVRRRIELQRRDRERAERPNRDWDRDRDGDRDRDRDRERERRRDWSQRPGGDPVDRANRDLDDSTRRQLQEQRRLQREQARPDSGQPNDRQRGGRDGRRGQDRQAPSQAAPPAAPDTEQHHPNLAPPPPPSAGEQRHPRNDMTERRQEN